MGVLRDHCRCLRQLLHRLQQRLGLLGRFHLLILAVAFWYAGLGILLIKILQLSGYQCLNQRKRDEWMNTELLDAKKCKKQGKRKMLHADHNVPFRPTRQARSAAIVAIYHHLLAASLIRCQMHELPSINCSKSSLGCMPFV